MSKLMMALMMASLLGCLAIDAHAKNPAASPDAVAAIAPELRESPGFLPEPGLLILGSLGILSLVLIKARVEG